MEVKPDCPELPGAAHQEQKQRNRLHGAPRPDDPQFQPLDSPIICQVVGLRRSTKIAQQA